MKYENPKEYLNQITNIDQKINTKLEIISQLWAKATRVNKPLKADLVQECGNCDTMAIMDKIIDYEQEVSRMISDMIDLQKQIQKEIEGLNNQLFSLVLLKRYCLCMTLMQISQELNYQESYIRKVHGWALQAFKDKYPDKF